MKRKLFTFLMAFLAIAGNAVWAQGKVHGSLQEPIDISSYDDAYLIDKEEGTWYLTTKGEVNTYGIKVGGSRVPTNPAKVKIYLINTSFDVGGSAIVIGTGETGASTDMIRYVDLELVLVGENAITSEGSAAAIKLRNDETVTLTISEESTGILNINMTGNGAVNQVAIGERGSSNWDPQHDCGSMYVNGGTIVTNGYIGEFDSHSFNMEGNGIVIAKDIVTSEIHENWLVDDGIYYETEEEGQNALNVVGNVTIKSPIPEDCPIYIGTGNTLTLGEGEVLDADKVIIEGGTINAYKVSYDINKPNDLISTNPSSFSTKYVGKNTPITEEFESLNPTDAYYAWGWLNSSSNQFVTTSPSDDPNGTKEQSLKGVWVVKNYTEEVEKNSEVTVPLVIPKEANVSISSPDKGWTVDETNKTISGKVGESDVTLEVPVGDEGKKATLIFNVRDDGQGGGDEPEEPIEISEDNGYNLDLSYLEASNLTYNSKDQKSTIELLVQVTHSDDVKPVVIDSENYTITITLDGKEVDEVIDADEYSIKVEGIEEKGYTGELTGTFKIDPATLTIEAIGIYCELNSTPDYSNVSFKCEPFEGDVVEPMWEGDTPTGTDKVNTAEAGTYTVTYSKDNIELTGDDAKNYVLEKDVECTITVMGEQGGDEGKININSLDIFVQLDEGKKFVYDGDIQEQDPSRLVVVKEKGNSGISYEEGVDFEVTLNMGEEENVLFKEAGEYDVVVTPIGDKLTGEPIVLKTALKIWPKPVNVIAKDIYYTIGQEDEVDMEGILSIEEGGICAVDEGLTIAITTSSLLTQEFLETWCTAPGTYSYTYKGVEIEGLSDNYEVVNDGDVKGNIIVSKKITEEDPLTPGDDSDQNAEITLGDGWMWNGTHFFRYYDGEAHPIETVLVKTNEGWVTLQQADGDFTVDYKGATVKNVDVYEIEITLKKYYDGKAPLKLFISPRKLEVELNLPEAIVQGQELYWNPVFADFEGLVAGEEGKIDGKLEVAEETENGLEVKIQGLKLVDNGSFLAKNYEAVYKHNGTILTLDEGGNGDIPGTIEVIDQAPAEDVKPNEDGWTSEDGKTFTRVYDGNSHAIEAIVVDNVTMTDGFTIDYNGADTRVKDAGRYEATITFDEGQYGPTTITLIITPRPMHVWFNLPATVKEASVQLPAADYVQYEAATDDRGLISADGTPVASGKLSISLPIDGKCSVKLMNFVLDENGEGFLPGNYQSQVWDATQGVWVDYTEGTEVVIVDPSDPDNDGQNEEGNPNGEGGSGITVDDGDDDNPDNPGTDPDEPGTDPDDPSTDPDDPTTDPDDPTKPEWPINPGKPGQGGSTSTSNYKHYNVYIEEVCDGIELSASRNLVREGNQVNIYMEIAEGCDTTGMKLEYKRGLFGTWDDLKLLESVQSGEYIIKHIYTDIYVRATGAKMDGSATGIEDLGDAQTKVYTQDGNIYVYAPERADVQIVNMAGVVVQRSEQIGLQAYDRLNPGIYIVRVGDDVFKVKL